MTIKIGLCGFPKSRKIIFSQFELVEIQKTFYDPGNPELYTKWREEAPKNFEFTVKAWQGVTHPASSPTWKRFKGVLWGKIDNYGELKDTEEVRYAFKLSLDILRRLDGDKMVIQLPPRQVYRDENLKILGGFVEEGIFICLEPRNKSWFKEEVIESLKSIGIVFVTDPFKNGIIDINEELIYLRLHGIGGYKYRYSDEDLEKLYMMIKDYIESKDVYILFNNVYMYQDALRFRKLLTSHT